MATENDFQGIMHARRVIQWYLTRLEDEMRLEESGDAKALLEQAFSALRVYANPVKLTVTTRGWFDTMFGYRHGGNSKLGACGDIPFYTHRETAGSLLRVLEVAFRAGCQIKVLKVMTDYKESSSRRDKAIDISGDTARALCRLADLELDVGQACSEFIKLDSALISVLSGVKGLVRVTFRSDPDYVFEPPSWDLAACISDMISALESHALRQAWMKEIVVFPDALLVMLRKHKSTLRNLTLSDVFLVGAWDTLLLNIRDELRLDKLVMINLSAIDEQELEDDDRPTEIRSWLSGGVELDGHERVTAGIDEVLSEWNRQGADPNYKPSWRSATDMAHLADSED